MPDADRLDAAGEALLDLVQSMALVFDLNWEMTSGQLEAPHLPWVIAAGGTFLRPNVEDESNNWANRGALLAAYRRAVEVLRDRGHDPEAVFGNEPAGGRPHLRVERGGLDG